MANAAGGSDTPASEHDTWPTADTRVLSRAQCADVIHKIFQLVQGGGNTSVYLSSWWNGEVRWARVELTSLSDRKDVMLTLDRHIRDARGFAFLNQVDDTSLAAAVTLAETGAQASAGHPIDELYLDPPTPVVPETLTWSDATFAATTESRSQLAETLMAGARDKGMLSAGYLEIRGGSSVTLSVTTDQRARLKTVQDVSDWMNYCLYTQTQCSMTVRHPKGNGSGWAGESSFDWAQVDPAGIAQRALEKCLQSVNPVRIEPGRYTVVLEPQALVDLLDLLLWREGGMTPLSRTKAEAGAGAFVLKPDAELSLIRSQLGLRIIDERITIEHDPRDQQLGTLPGPGLAPATWIKHGVLQALHYDRDYAVVRLHENDPMVYRPAYRMSGGTMSIGDMIASTQRGLLVTRFSGLMLLDDKTLLATGLTRDGLWLIERGTITKAVNNMRIMESPLFVLNNVEQLGVPVPVFRPVKNPFEPKLTPAIVPPIKANDFNFTGTLDAM